MNDSRIVICNHPNLLPTQWNQDKPEPTEIKTCDCGSNWCCYVCGNGGSMYPCKCFPSEKDVVGSDEPRTFNTSLAKEALEALLQSRKDEDVKIADD